jgi:molecular chaperone GrpE
MAETEIPGREPNAAASNPAGPRPPARSEDELRVVDRRWWARADGELADQHAAPTSDKPAYVQELEQRLAANAEELRTTISRYRDANAEFEQARVRFRRDVAKEVERGKRAILADLLDVVDNLDRAIAAARATSPGDALLSGIELVRAQFLGTLEGYGVKPIEASGQIFDPTVHEAATMVPVTDPGQDGRIVGVIRQGYAIGDEVLRPAVVAVARLTSEGAPS